MDVYEQDKSPLVQGATLPILETVWADDAGNVFDITGMAVTLTFWYAGQDPHLVASGYVYDGPNGIARYQLSGAETPTPPNWPGDLLYQWTLTSTGPVNQSAPQDWARISSHEFKRNVLQAVES